MYTTWTGWVLILATVAYTLTAALCDHRFRKVPNKLTLPVFAAGWVYQIIRGLATDVGLLSALLDGLAGFAIGFGLLFLMWMIAGGGGGDAKLMGALSVWLGWDMTLAVFIVSTVFVILGSGFVLTMNMLNKGVFKTKNKFMPGSAPEKTAKRQHPTHDIKNRRIMAYAIPVCCATIVVTMYMVPDWPFRRKAEQVNQTNKPAAEQPGTESSIPVQTTDAQKS